MYPQSSVNRPLLARLRDSSFVKNMLVVMSGTVAAQLLTLALLPVVSRLFSPSDFGVYGAFNALLTVIAAAATLHYAEAAMLTKRREDATHLFFLAFVSTSTVSGCVLAFYVLFPGFFQGLLHEPSGWMPVLLALGVLVRGSNKTLQFWCARVKKFKHTSASQVIRSVSSNGVHVGLGYLQNGPAPLVYGAILGELLGGLNLARDSGR